MGLTARLLALFMALVLAAATSVSAAWADENHEFPDDLPPPPVRDNSGHDHGLERPEMSRVMDGGNARRYSKGDTLTYRVEVAQTLRPSGPYEAESRDSRLEILLTETVEMDGEDPLVTLEVVEAKAEGFLAEAEERAALERTIAFRPGPREAQLVLKEGPDGVPDLLDPETIKSWGDLGEIRMVDIALRAHLLNPVIPSSKYSEGSNFRDNAAFPAGWSKGPQTLVGGITVRGEDLDDGRKVVRVDGVHVSTDTLLRVRAMDNAVEALQGIVLPEPNEFFAGTLFHALFPPGSSYESLMPALPLPVTVGNRTRQPPGRPKRRRLATGRALALGGVMMLALASCNAPERNVDVVSLNLTGPIQFNHEGMLDHGTGILISSQVEATARLSGEVFHFPQEIAAVLPEALGSLSGVPIGMDAGWTVTQQLEGDWPKTAGLLTGSGAAVGGVLLFLGLAAMLLVLRKKNAPVGEPASQPETATQ